jgi:hypothetical protein
MGYGKIGQGRIERLAIPGARSLQLRERIGGGLVSAVRNRLSTSKSGLRLHYDQHKQKPNFDQATSLGRLCTQKSGRRNLHALGRQKFSFEDWRRSPCSFASGVRLRRFDYFLRCCRPRQNIEFQALGNGDFGDFGYYTQSKVDKSLEEHSISVDS